MSLGSIHDQPGSLYGAQALDFFKELFDKDAGNKICVDCGAHNPLWASLSYGTYFCLECSGVHRNLGVHISFVRSLNMDSWSLQQQAKMRLGGNTALQRYLRAAGMPEEYNRNGSPQSIRDKYQSRAAEAYRDHLGKVGRGEASGPPPQVLFEVAVVQQRDTKQMSGFGSAPPPASASSFDGMGGLDSLMSGLGSLGSKTVNLTSKVAAVAAPRLSNLKDSVKSVAVLAAERASTIGGPPDASALSLAHLRAGRGEGSSAVAGGGAGAVEDSFEGFGAEDTDVLSKVGETASWLGAVPPKAALTLAPAAPTPSRVPPASAAAADGWGDDWGDDDAALDAELDAALNDEPAPVPAPRAPAVPPPASRTPPASRAPPPSVPSAPPASTPSGTAAGVGRGDRNGVEPLEGESEAEYVARQQQIREEAAARMRAKFGGSGGLGGGMKMGGVGSSGSGGGGGGGMLSSLWGTVKSIATEVAAEISSEPTPPTPAPPPPVAAWDTSTRSGMGHVAAWDTSASSAPVTRAPAPEPEPAAPAAASKPKKVAAAKKTADGWDDEWGDNDKW
eukprot:jgi/Chrpa1/10799/Chrysochromulina_OHIO_Genome00020191-RA